MNDTVNGTVKIFFKVCYILALGFHYYFFHKETGLGVYDVFVPRKAEIKSIFDRIIGFLRKDIKNVV